MGFHIIILGFYDNKENKHYRYLVPSLYLNMLYGTTSVAPAVVFQEHLRMDVFTRMSVVLLICSEWWQLPTIGSAPVSPPPL